MVTAKKALLGDTVVMRKLIECFMSQQSGAYQDMTKRSRRTAIAQVAAHRLISKAMQLHKQHVYYKKGKDFYLLHKLRVSILKILTVKLLKILSTYKC